MYVFDELLEEFYDASAIPRTGFGKQPPTARRVASRVSVPAPVLPFW